MSDKDCEACEAYKAYWFVTAVKAGIDTASRNTLAAWNAIKI